MHSAPLPLDEARKLAQEMLDGLEGLPAGPWRLETEWPVLPSGYVVTALFNAAPYMPTLREAAAFVVSDHNFSDEENVRLGEFIARCSPENIALLCRALAATAAPVAQAPAVRGPLT